MLSPRQLQDAYQRGENIGSLLRNAEEGAPPLEDIIETSYDLQTGSYIATMSNPYMAERRRVYGRDLAQVIASYGRVSSVLEAGVGEGMTLAVVLSELGNGEIRKHAFDISWSRVAYARAWLSKHGHDDVALCTARMDQMPYADGSMDVVYTSHALEPNRGKEEELLRELYRVCGRLLVLLEPAYELGDDAARARMDQYNYCRGIVEKAKGLGMRVVRHELFTMHINPANPTALTVIEKEGNGSLLSEPVVCPQFRTSLEAIGGMLYSAEALSVYPVLDGIPCLRRENAIRASKYPESLGVRGTVP